MNISKIINICSPDQQKRYRARYDFVTALAERWGLRTYNKDLAWLNDKAYQTAWKEYPEATNYIHDRKFTLFNLTKTLNAIPGDIAECGVFKAGSSFLMLSASQDTQKHFYGFDSFEGLSKPGDLDQVENERTFAWKSNDMLAEENIARDNVNKFKERVSLYKGWIPDRFNEVEDKKFSLVHIDVDLYQPTKDALHFFGTKMNAGGMIVCDDYGFESCPGARQAMDEFTKDNKLEVLHLTTGQGIIIFNQNN